MLNWLVYLKLSYKSLIRADYDIEAGHNTLSLRAKQLYLLFFAAFFVLKGNSNEIG